MVDNILGNIHAHTPVEHGGSIICSECKFKLARRREVLVDIQTRRAAESWLAHQVITGRYLPERVGTMGLVFHKSTADGLHEELLVVRAGKRKYQVIKKITLRG